jgi:hypothetical protein
MFAFGVRELGWLQERRRGAGSQYCGTRPPWESPQVLSILRPSQPDAEDSTNRSTCMIGATVNLGCLLSEDARGMNHRHARRCNPTVLYRPVTYLRS